MKIRLKNDVHKNHSGGETSAAITFKLGEAPQTNELLWLLQTDTEL